MTSNRNLWRDERGWVFAQLAALIIAPILLVMIATATIGAMRTGTGITQTVDRAVLAELLVDDFKNSIATASTVTATGAKTLSARIDPAALPPALPVDIADIPATCVTIDWELRTEGSLVSLVRTVKNHATVSCASTVATTIESKFTGLTSTAKFTYRNVFGRELTYSGGTLTPVAGAAPAGVTATQWNDNRLAFIRIDATMQELIGSRALGATAQTNLPIR